MVDTTAQRGAIVYGRQSHGKEASVEDQISAGQARCADLGRPVLRTAQDAVSASRFGTAAGKKREDWPQLVADVAAGGVGLVWLWDASRGDRTPQSWHQFLDACRDQRVEVYSERDEYSYRPWVPRDWKTLADSGNDAAYESEIRSVDVRRGVAGAARAGKPHGRARYGYTRIYNSGDRRKFNDEPDECAPIAAEIIKRVAKRDPIVVIQRDLYSRGVPSPEWPGVPWKFKPWARRTIKMLVLNPAYAGLRSHTTDGGKTTMLYEATWPAIVDRVTWEAARAVLTEPGRKSSAPGAVKWLLSYLMVSPHGGPTNVQPARAGRTPRYRCLDDGCTTIGVAEAEEYVTRVVLARLVRPDTRAMFAVTGAAMDDALGELAAVTAEARELEKAARAGLRPALLAAADEGIQERLRAAEARVAACSSNAAALALLGDGEFTAATARPRWDDLSVAARRSVITALIERIELQPTDVRLTRWSTADERLRLAAERMHITPRRAAR